MDITDFFQNFRLRQVEHSGSETQLRASETARRVQELEREVDVSSLMCQAMWEFMSKVEGFTSDDLRLKMEEIDLRDGKVDGKFRPAPKVCPSCKRRISARRARCYFCGVATKSTGSQP